MPYEKAGNIFKLVSEMKDILICTELRSLMIRNWYQIVFTIQTISPIKIDKKWLYTKMLEDLCIKLL